MAVAQDFSQGGSRGGVGFFLDKEIPESPGDIAGAGRFFEDKFDDVVAVEIAALAEESFFSFVVAPALIVEMFAVVGPAGEGAGRPL